MPVECRLKSNKSNFELMKTFYGHWISWKCLIDNDWEREFEKKNQQQINVYYVLVNEK